MCVCVVCMWLYVKGCKRGYALMTVSVVVCLLCVCHRRLYILSTRVSDKTFEEGDEERSHRKLRRKKKSCRRKRWSNTNEKTLPFAGGCFSEAEAGMMGVLRFPLGSRLMRGWREAEATAKPQPPICAPAACRSPTLCHITSPQGPEAPAPGLWLS